MIHLTTWQKFWADVRNGGIPIDSGPTLVQRIKRIRCWWRGYHVGKPKYIDYKFRYDVHGICWDCGRVGTGISSEDGE